MLRCALLLLLLPLLAACSVSEDERNFFYQGWTNPNKRRVFRETEGPLSTQTPLPAGYKTDPLVD